MNRAPPALAFPHGLDATRFVADYWQRRPLLMRAAWRGFRDPLSPEELAGLACEDEVAARLIDTACGARPWRLRHGPFDDDDFLNLPPTHWTLLVYDVEKHLPALADVLEPFRFIPDWRVDDLMISYAADGGSVGPHWDDYDVFLLQGAGRRRWQIDTCPVGDADRIDADGLRLVRDFRAAEQWLLEPGDILYLPPRVVHYGIADGPSMTYSIGFRAPADGELAAAFSRYLAAGDAGPRYRDPAPDADGGAGYHPGRISAAALTALRTRLRARLAAPGDDELDDWLGCHLTDEPGFEPPPRATALDAAALCALCTSGATLRRAPGLRLAFRDRADGGCTLFCAGRAWPLPAAAAGLAALLSGQRRYDGGMLVPWLSNPDAAALLLALVNQGCLDNDNDNDNDNDSDSDSDSDSDNDSGSDSGSGKHRDR